MNIHIDCTKGAIFVQRELTEEQQKELKEYMDLYPTYKVVYTNEF